jgi:tetratricopeptide (TPR) repeat protein
MKRNISLAACALTVTAIFAPKPSRADCLPAVPAPVNQAAAVSSASPQFDDEPRFTVAGVADANNLGGHGSDTVARTKETLAKEAAALGTTAVNRPTRAISSGDQNSLRTDLDRLRTQLAESPGNADLHHALADAEERLNRPLDAVREYQRAAELNPSEVYLFDWGTELLAHRAPEAAAEVFAHAARVFPHSSRLLIGLGLAWHARGAYDRAGDCLVQASDLNPYDPEPYLFLAKMQIASTLPSNDVVEKLARFVNLHPESALAHYYYAGALWKRARFAPGKASRAQVRLLLKKAIRLDSQLADAYVLLAVVASEEGDSHGAISELQRAVAINPQLEEPHYRLAQAYRRIGERAKAQRELIRYRDLSKKAAARAERERLEIPQFVIALRDARPSSTAP